MQFNFYQGIRERLGHTELPKYDKLIEIYIIQAAPGMFPTIYSQVSKFSARYRGDRVTREAYSV